MLAVLVIIVMAFVAAGIALGAARRKRRAVRHERYERMVEQHRVDKIHLDHEIALREACREDCCQVRYDVPPTLDREVLERWLESV